MHLFHVAIFLTDYCCCTEMLLIFRVDLVFGNFVELPASPVLYSRRRHLQLSVCGPPVSQPLAVARATVPC